MAYEQNQEYITLLSSGDNSSNQYKIVVASSANNAGGAVLVATRGAKFTGILASKSTASAQAERVQVSGVAKVLCGCTSGMDDAIIEGGLIISSSKGTGIPSSSGADNHIVGMALASLATGTGQAVLPVLLAGPGGALST